MPILKLRSKPCERFNNQPINRASPNPRAHNQTEMKTTKWMLALAALILSSTFVYAQPGGQGMRKNIRTKKIIFITEKLDLSPEEAQVFWPVYNEFDKKAEDIRKQKRQLMPRGPQAAELSDKEAEQKVDQLMALKMQEANLQQEYHARFKQVLPARKVAKLYMAEEMFNRRLMQELGKKHGQGRGRGPGQGNGPGSGNGRPPGN